MIIGSLKKKSDMRSIILVLILLGGLIYHGSCLAQLDKVKTIEGQTYQLQFSDEFNGTNLDTTKWTYRTDSKHWSTQLPGNVEVKNGFLQLNLKKEKSQDKDYTGAGVISKDTFQSNMMLPVTTIKKFL